MEAQISTLESSPATGEAKMPGDVQLLSPEPPLADLNLRRTRLALDIDIARSRRHRPLSGIGEAFRPD